MDPPNRFIDDSLVSTFLASRNGNQSNCAGNRDQLPVSAAQAGDNSIGNES
jgi:hypothetical protein